MSGDQIQVGDHVEVTTIRNTTGIVEKIVPWYRTAVLRLDGSGGTLSATLRELRKLPVSGSDGRSRDGLRGR